jgi:hypothetical protein
MVLKDMLSVLPGMNGVVIVKDMINPRRDITKKDITNLDSNENKNYLKFSGRVALSLLYFSYGLISYNQNSLNPNNWSSENPQKRYNIENVVKE